MHGAEGPWQKDQVQGDDRDKELFNGMDPNPTGRCAESVKRALQGRLEIRRRTRHGSTQGGFEPNGKRKVAPVLAVNFL